MNEHESARRRLLGEAATALPALIVLTLLGRHAPARAGNGSKEDFHYQDHPNETKRCANCTQFIPPAEGKQFGSCQILDGPISPNGWCMAFTPKQDQ